MAPSNSELCRLYLISPPTFDLDDFSSQLSLALKAGDVACLQLRLKGASDGAIRTASSRLIPICKNHGVAFVINDRPDLAADVGADGVHIGVDDVSYTEARRLVGQDAIVGVSCYNSRHLAMVAGENGASYIAFGAFFPTTTKQPRVHAEPELLTWWQTNTTVPCVAIGGVSVQNCGVLVRAGADFLAVISGIWSNPDGPGVAVSIFNEEIKKHSNVTIKD